MKNQLITLITSVVVLAACSKGGDDVNGIPVTPPTGNTDYKKVDVTSANVFYSGKTSNDANSYRIPSIVTASDGKLIAVCEARWNSWADGSPTDIAMKIGSEDGKIWSDYIKLTNQSGTQAFMDPVAVADAQANKIFVFTTDRPARGANVTTAQLITIEKVGDTWQKTGIKDVGNLFNKPDRSMIVGGFGPGSGLQMVGAPYAGRLIVPVRMAKLTDAGTYANAGNTALYSDDHGVTWKLGNLSNGGGEFQIAESPKGNLIYNLRSSAQRFYGRSTDGGVTWSPYAGYANPEQIPAPDKGCHGSVIGNGDILYYSGPEGIATTAEHDSRGRLILCKSSDGGTSWGGKSSRSLLYEKASGYSCMTFLKDGRLAVLAEVADSDGFNYYADASGKRPAGWMRLDIFIIN